MEILEVKQKFDLMLTEFEKSEINFNLISQQFLELKTKLDLVSVQFLETKTKLKSVSNEIISVLETRKLEEQKDEMIVDQKNITLKKRKLDRCSSVKPDTRNSSSTPAELCSISRSKRFEKLLWGLNTKDHSDSRYTYLRTKLLSEENKWNQKSFQNDLIRAVKIMFSKKSEQELELLIARFIVTYPDYITLHTLLNDVKKNLPLSLEELAQKEDEKKMQFENEDEDEHQRQYYLHPYPIILENTKNENKKINLNNQCESHAQKENKEEQIDEKEVHDNKKKQRARHAANEARSKRYNKFFMQLMQNKKYINFQRILFSKKSADLLLFNQHLGLCYKSIHPKYYDKDKFNLEHSFPDQNKLCKRINQLFGKNKTQALS